MENERLRQAKADFDHEREHLCNQIQALEQEVKALKTEIKENKKKSKKLERIVYGKKWFNAAVY